MRALALILWAALALAQPTAVRAHEGGTTGYAAIAIDGHMVRYTLTLSAVPHPAAAADHGWLVAAIADKIRLTSDGAACEPGPGYAVPSGEGVVSVTALVDFVCPGPVGELVIRDDLFDVLGDDLHTLARIEWPGHTEQAAFATEQRLARASVGDDAAAAHGSGSFFRLGVEHMLSGYDHLLFLLMLILRAEGIVQLLKIVTAFTVAHSITLALATLGVVDLPGRLVEAVIALSIAWVALENLLSRRPPARRLAVSFVFGLVHGFGFSSVLSDLGLPRENFAVALLSFNLGVEAGQVAVVLLTVPVLLWLHRTRFEPGFGTTVSTLVLVFGLGLFVERVWY